MRHYSTWTSAILILVGLWSFSLINSALGLTLSEAPMFQGRNLTDNSDISLEDFEGYVLIINFWATWCPPCRVEIPGFVELQSKYKDEKFSVIGMSLDRAGERVVKNFIAAHNINYPVIMAVGQIESDYEKAMDSPIFGIPTTLIVDREGTIVSVHVGARPKEVFEQEILELLEDQSVENITIISTPITTGTEGVAYSYDVEATGGDDLTYSLIAAPTGMTIDPTTGLITWTPSSTQAGSHPVTVQATYEHGGSDAQSFTIDVAEAINNAPVIISAPRITGTEEVLYQYEVEAKDADSDPLAFSLATFPEGMTIDVNTGLIDWNPANAQAGDNDVVVRVDDGRNESDTQSFTITVSNVNDPPMIASTAVTMGLENTLYTYDVDATDPDAGDILTYSLILSPGAMAIDAATGLIQWTPGYDAVKTAEGTRGFNVTIRVTDSQGDSDEESIAITIGNVNRPPEAHSLAIGPGSPSTTSDLNYSYVYTDLDGDTESGSRIRWYEDGELQESYNDQKTVPSTATAGGQQWYFTVRPRDGVDFGDLQTSAPTTIIDTASPVITSGPSTSDVTCFAATVTWITDEAGNSVVEYGAEPGHGLTAEGAGNVTEHSVPLGPLSAGTTYYYRVGSTDASGNTTWSEQRIFSSTGIRGDVNNDGEIRSNDAILALRIAARLMEPNDCQEWTADMNNDGRIRSDDAILILRAIAGLGQ